jgi:hypothetical protein
MGTSQSSLGSPSGVPMVPPWVPDPFPQEDPQEDPQDPNVPEDNDQESPNGQPQDPEQIPTSPQGRFGPARLNMGKFAQSGNSHDMRRGLREYVRKGYGGSRTATQRLAGTTRTAGSLYGALSSMAAGKATPDGLLDPMLLSGRKAREVIDAILESVRPVDGTQDAEASRHSICDALSVLLKRFPDADLVNLSKIERLFVIEQFLARDVCQRFDLDLGKHVQAKAETALEGLKRLKQIREYIAQTVSSAFQQLHKAGQRLSARRISQIAQSTLQGTFKVFEEYV